MASGGGSKKNVRLYPRFECFASVRIDKAGDAVVIQTKNVSLGGALLAVKPAHKELLPIGRAIDVVLFDAMDESDQQVKIPATVVRHDPDGVALSWSATDPDTAYDLAALLDKLKRKK